MKKGKYKQIFNYLLEFSKLRSNPVRNIESSESQYPSILWLSDIPQYDIFDCITFPTFPKDADYWLKIRKPKDEPIHPSFPRISDTLNKWILPETLISEDGTPLLRDYIVIDNEKITLNEKPEILKEFEEYLNNRWIDDLEKYKKALDEYKARLYIFERKDKTYKQIFNIYNKAQHFGEEFELVFGVGLLHFRESDTTPLICRHILTAKAEINFEFSQRESFVKVSPGADSDIHIETDAILDLFDQFDSSDIIEAEKLLVEYLNKNEITDSIFDIKIKEALQYFADRVHTDGQSRDDLAKSKTVEKKPTIYFAPALLLRKRNTRSFTALYEKIIQNIDNSNEGIDIPTMNDIIGFYDESEVNPSLSGSSNDSLKDETIYFPQKYNDEQIEIVEKIRRNNKVLVQGPPGTGKSHTIANLICHLLANGKKVLVTAYTKRALEVLKTQLPEDFKKLTVNLLSSDSESLHDLDSSVNTIIDELSRISDLKKNKEEIEENEREFTFIKEKIAFTKNGWLKVKEKSIRKQCINRNYEGSLIEIAERLEKEKSSFTWFTDDINNINRVDCIPEIKKFISQAKYYQSIDCSQFSYIIPQKESIISLSYLREYKKADDELNQKSSFHKTTSYVECKDFLRLIKLLQSLYDLYTEIDNSHLPFKSKVISDCRKNFALWKEKQERVKTSLKELPTGKLKHFDRNIEIIYPSNKSLIQLKSDAQTLLSFLNEGNELSGMMFNLKKVMLPANIKEKLYFISEVKVNGSFCNTKAEFQTVVEDIRIKQEIEEIESILELGLNGKFKTYFDKISYFDQLNKDTDALIGLLQAANDLKGQIANTSTVKIQAEDSAAIKSVIDETNFNYLRQRASIFKEKIADKIKYLSTSNMHPIAALIADALKNIDADKYEQYLAQIDSLISERKAYDAYIELKDNLYSLFPSLIQEILDNSFEFSNLPQLENAIYFKHAFGEITRLLSEDYEAKLSIKMEDLEKQKEKLISSVGSKKAWLKLLESLNKNPLMRQHLQAWLQAIQKMGKTETSKKSIKHRKDAQEQMEVCKDSVPCWIMPLYKVTETVNPQQGMYDYVIIDEASQLGADAIFLLYIAKNIIIVGDDKQTSPEYVGVEADKMTPHINRYLQGIPFGNYYGTEFSFFDHAKRFCNGMTVLREHFRCMPEIIEFPNRYFYAPDGIGLYPLKQYSENRLEPLKTVYCQGGYIEGSYQNIVNLVEAEAIADKIAELVADDNYKDKSFGVIGLQGTKQAVLIENLILKRIGEVEYKKRNIICGTSASFQGDERDIMFLSLITAHNHNKMPLTKPEDERRFNVAASRAKEQVWLFHSVQLEDLTNTNDLRYKLLDHFLNYRPKQLPQQKPFERKPGTQPEPFESWFEVDVYNDIVNNNYPVIPQYEVAKGKYRIDLVVILKNGVKIAVECDGDKFHGPEQFRNDMMRQKVLERCGWQFFRVRGAEYYSNRKKSLEPLWKLLHENDIQIVDVSANTTSTGGYESDIRSSESKAELIDDVESNPQSGVYSKEETFPFLLVNEVKAAIPGEITAEVSSPGEFLIFSSMYNVYKVKKENIDLQEAINQIEFEKGEKLLYSTETSTYSGYLIVAFQNGKVGKISMTSFQTEQNRKKLKNAFNDESKLVFIEHIEEDVDLVAISNINKVVLFNTGTINPVESRTAKGIQVMKMRDTNSMIKVRRLSEVKLQNPEYYRRDDNLNVVGYFLKPGDRI